MGHVLRIAPELNNALLNEAAQLGITPEKNQERILLEHAKALFVASLPEDLDAQIPTPAEGRAWILQRNPDLQRVASGEIDWRRLAHEGHRY